MQDLIGRILSRQDPKARHSPLTRVVVSLLILASSTVLYGFYGLMAAIAVYLLGVELMGLERRWALGTVALGLVVGALLGSWRVGDYVRHHGHGE